MVFCLLDLSISDRGWLKFPVVMMGFSVLLAQFLVLIVWQCIVRYIHDKDCYVFLENWSLYHMQCSCLSLLTFLALKSALPKVNVAEKVKVTQSCLTLCDPMDYTVHGILQARILEWVAFPFSRGSSQRRHRTQVSCIAGGFLTSWARGELFFISAIFLVLSFH